MGLRDRLLRKVSTRKRVALALSLPLGLYGWLSIVGRGVALRSGGAGWNAAWLDPAFTITHSLTIPLATYLIAMAFPVDDAKRWWRHKTFRTGFLGACAGLLLLGTWFAADNARKSVCSADFMSTPELFGDVKLQSDLVAIRALQPSADTARLTILRKKYAETLQMTEPCNYTKRASLYAWYGAVGPIIAFWWVAAALAIAWVPVVGGAQYQQRFWEVFFSSCGLVATWLLLVPLSQWYIRFGATEGGNNGPLIFGLVAAFLLILAIAKVKAPTLSAFLNMSILVISAVMGAIQKFKPGWMQAVGQDLYFERSLPEVCLMYAGLALFISLLLPWKLLRQIAVTGLAEG